MALTKEKLQQLFAAGEFDLPGGDWDSITGKPTSFPTTWALVSGKPTVFATNWEIITGKPSTFPPSTHTHTKVNITDFPTSMPASDVYAWAKAATKPSYTHTEVGAAASSHSHSQNQVNVTISGYGLSTQAITDYPSGFSVQYGGGTGTPSTVGQLITFNGGIYRNFQLWNAKDSENLYIRNYRSEDAVWSTWMLFLHTGNYTTYAQKKITTGTTYPSSPADGDIHIYG